ncbi:MAG: sugar phosphate nucleotidyltransferase [Clostridia bacterium]
MDLVIMAAGMGSRFGGLKQVECVNADGDFIIDYSIYDCIKNNFKKVFFIIKEENYDLFRETVGKRVENKIKVEYVFQKLDNLPKGYSVPQNRVKPWGTAHAILCCKNVVKNNFAIINADDFYGQNAFKTISKFLKENISPNKYALVGYKVKNTISENGTTKRGICEIKNGKLANITESFVEVKDKKIYATPIDGDTKKQLEPETIVSMNLFGFTPKIFNYLELKFKTFLKNNITNLKSEFLIPSVVGELIKENKVSVETLSTSAVWYGITYKEDKQIVVDALKILTENGEYPKHLWSQNNI